MSQWPKRYAAAIGMALMLISALLVGIAAWAVVWEFRGVQP